MGGKSDSGEGGEDPRRFEPYPNGDWARSRIKQVASPYNRQGALVNFESALRPESQRPACAGGCGAVQDKPPALQSGQRTDLAISRLTKLL